MNVRKTTATTFSLVVLIIGLYLLIPVIQRALPYEVWHIIDERFYQKHSISGFYSSILSISVWLIVVVGIFDAILNNRVALALLSSLNIPVILGIIVIIFTSIPSVNNYLFWGLLYTTTILGIYWTFRKFITNNHPKGQKLIPFIQKIKLGVETGSGHISDRYTVFSISILLTGVYVLLIVSFVVYVVAHWGMFS